LIALLEEMVHQEQFRILGADAYRELYEQYNQDLGYEHNPLEIAAHQKALEIFSKFEAGANMSYINPYIGVIGTRTGWQNAYSQYVNNRVYYNGYTFGQLYQRRFLQ